MIHYPVKEDQLEVLLQKILDLFVCKQFQITVISKCIQIFSLLMYTHSFVRFKICNSNLIYYYSFVIISI